MAKCYDDYSRDELIKLLHKQDEELAIKKYGLTWDSEKEPEKVVLDCENNLPILENISEKEIKTDNSNFNILIEGDNYHALTVLNYTHKEKIDVIYIDPPYNTGNKDFKYNDSYVDKEDGYKHSKWLNFMEKRLKLAKNLLSEYGVMFISIDEHEFANLKLLCDKLFGENNVECIIWRKNAKQGNTKIIKRIRFTHEYIIVAYKNKYKTLFKKVKLLPNWKGKKTNPDKDPRGNWESGVICRDEENSKIDSPNYYSITLPSGRVLTREFYFDKKQFENYMNDNKIYFPKNGDGIPRLKIFEKEEQEYYFDSIIDEMGTFTSAREQLVDIIGKDIFETPKPLKMLKEIIRSSSKNDSIILDFMAGSGTTGHAVCQLNKEDNGNRKFILCTNNENNICTEICYPRIKKVMQGYINSNGESIESLGGNLKYFKTSLIPVEKIDRINDNQRQELTQKAGQIIAIKENTFNQVELNDWFQVFENNNKTHRTAIYFREDLSHFDELIESLKDIKTTLYIFSYGRIDKKLFTYLNKNISIEDIPEPIIEMYKEINLTLKDK